MRGILFIFVMFLCGLAVFVMWPRQKKISSVLGDYTEVVVRIPESVVEEASKNWFHYDAQPRDETRAEYTTRRIFEYATPICSFGRFKTPQEAGITWEVKEK